MSFHNQSIKLAKRANRTIIITNDKNDNYKS